MYLDAARLRQGISGLLLMGASTLVIVSPALPAVAETVSNESAGAEQRAARDPGTGDPVAADLDATSTEPGGEAEVPQFTFVEQMTVVGREEQIPGIGGSAHVITLEQLREKRYDDIHRILGEIPGVNFQEEDGYGLRPNIGMRGTGVERSAKITLMEDGVLIAPAPYAAPAAYYFPTAARMEGVEVLKGSAAIKQGPYTNGGALNLISAAIPGTFGGRLDAAVGQNRTTRAQGLVGDSGERFGWMLQGYTLGSDGFKKLDGGGSTGTDVDDLVAKLRFNGSAESARQQALELKLGKTLQDGHETYLGLIEADFRQDPYRRYVGSSRDRIDSDHQQVQLRHFLSPSRRIDVSTTVYQNEFERDWFKNESVGGISNRTILANPEIFARQLSILRGEIDSDPAELHLRHNRRKYYSRGIETIVALQLGARHDHELEIGLRYHEDEEDRFQEDDLYQMLAGSLELTREGIPGSNSNRVGDARATALFVQDRVVLGRWVVTPGVRWESIRHRRLDYSKTDPERQDGPVTVRTNNVSVVLPGLGVAYEVSGKHHFFAGVHRGFAPPGTGSSEDTEPEESLNYELGWRFRAAGLSADLTLFHSDYDNLLGVETVSGGGSSAGDLFNGGAVKVRGLEASLSQRWRLGGRSYLPFRLAYTYTVGRFQSSFATKFADWAPRVEVGDQLPYLPEHQLQLSAGFQRGRWSTSLNGSYMDRMRTSAGQGPIAEGEGTDRRFVVDLSAQWQAFGPLAFYGQIRNLTDEAYLVSWRPYGARPGLDRTALVGLSVDF